MKAYPALAAGLFVAASFIQPAFAAKLSCSGMLWGLQKFTIDTETGDFDPFGADHFQMTSQVTTSDQYYRFDITLVTRGFTSHVTIDRSNGVMYGNDETIGTCQLMKPPVM